ncbi:uncharacterized protein CMC5_008550 [Chondromyces crocatus]|uniref:Uncharacterized protein n=1 Tax=Chondromyces crocatus TaxID=52 RepID=A0A0K1E7A1_CHOCO|nr:uncharacterized protein CMC5_008550 [Chondromyces crocatus]
MRAKGFTWVVLISADSALQPPQPCHHDASSPLSVRVAEPTERRTLPRRDAWPERER